MEVQMLLDELRYAAMLHYAMPIWVMPDSIGQTFATKTLAFFSADFPSQTCFISVRQGKRGHFCCSLILHSFT